MTQGKCKTCKVRWTWQGPINAKRTGVHCPCCLGPLQATTHHLRWRTRVATRSEVRYGWYTGTPHCRQRCQAQMGAAEMAEISRLEGGWQPYFWPETP